MKKLLAAVLMLGLGAGWAQAADKPQMQTLEDKASYIIGFQFGTDMARDEIKIHPDLFQKGLKAGLAGEEPALSAQEMDQVMGELRQKLMAKAQAKAQKLSAENRKKGDAFRAEYAKEKGVKQLPNGIMYKVIKPGDGPKPGPRDQVQAMYTGKLIDGTKFDSSEGRGGPVSFPLDQVIPGWSEALQQMPKGSTWEIVLPPDMAYGDRQAGPLIQPGSTLVFEVQLVDFQPPKEQPAAK